MHSERWAHGSCSCRSPASSTSRSRRWRPREPQRRTPAERAAAAGAAARLPGAAPRLGLVQPGEDEGALHSVDPGERSPLAVREGTRLADGGVLAAAGVDGRPHGTRGVAREAGRTNGRDPAADRPFDPRGDRLRSARGSTSWLPHRTRPLLQLASSSLSLNWDEALLRIALAGVLGGLIGLERELREREAGLRTHLLVSVGAALFTIAGAYGFESARVDPTRVAAQIVTGIGFLGAGAIIRQGFSVRGLTTAATLWVVAAVGLAAGAGYYSAAVVTTALVLIALYPLRIIAFRILRRFRPEDGRLLVELPAGSPPGEVIDEVERRGARIGSIEVSQEGDRRRLELDVVLPRGVAAPRLVAGIADVPNVADVRWSD